MMNEIIVFLADFLVAPIVIVAVYALVRYVDNKAKLSVYSRILVAGLTAYLLAKLIGSIYQPADMRPFELLGVEPGASYLENPGFPSDHMLFVTAIVCAVWFGTKRIGLTVALAACALLVGLGRVLALVHTPLDVIGAVFIALVGSLWYINEPKVTGGRKRRQSHGRSGRR